jgi:hypothetical protein
VGRVFPRLLPEPLQLMSLPLCILLELFHQTRNFTDRSTFSACSSPTRASIRCINSRS